MSMMLTAACVPPEGGADQGSPPVGAEAPRAVPEPAPDGERQGSCNAAAVQDLRGRHLNDQIAAIARERSGAKAVRVIQPDQAVTMDYSPDRLNIEVMEDSRILNLRCG